MSGTTITSGEPAGSHNAAIFDEETNPPRRCRGACLRQPGRDLEFQGGDVFEQFLQTGANLAALGLELHDAVGEVGGGLVARVELSVLLFQGRDARLQLLVTRDQLLDAILKSDKDVHAASY